MELGRAFAGLEEQLRLAIGLRSSRSLRLIALAGRKTLHIQFAKEASWGVVTSQAFVLLRERPVAFGKPLSRPFAELLKDGALLAALARPGILERASAGAARLLAGILDSDRRTFTQLAKWTPVIEIPVYAIAARLMAVLDLTREGVLAVFATGDPDADRLTLSYQKLVRALERTTLIATEAGSSWLAAMAASFEWGNWSPSFPLTRERTLLGSLIGARAASRFGPGVVDDYFASLARARHPVHALDAIVGLTAIGLRHAAQGGTIARRLERMEADRSDDRFPSAGVVSLARNQAVRLLGEGGSASPLLSTNWRQDAFGTDAQGHLRVLKLLPGALDASPSKFVRPGGELTAPSSRMAREAFERAWGSSGAGHGTDPPPVAGTT